MLPKGAKYRLPTDAEWSTAVGLAPEVGATPEEKSSKNDTALPWGKAWPPPPKAGNYADETFHARFPGKRNEKENRDENLWIAGYTDGHTTTSPVGSFPANAFGLYDMGGNVWQWCEDWWNREQTDRVLRGASWDDRAQNSIRSSGRRRSTALGRLSVYGFRCVLEPAPSSVVSPSPGPEVSPSPIASATKGAPFVNSLGMKFVPVAIGGGATKGERVLFSVWHTRVQDYAEFAKAQEAAGKKVDRSWKVVEKDGVPVGREPDHPVLAVNWDDAQAFCAWLTAKETAEGKLPPGMKYRLPSDEEWSWAVGLPLEAGATPAEKHAKNDVDYPWGKDWPPNGKVGNYADETFHAKFPMKRNTQMNRDENLWIEGYTDGFATTSPVGSFPENAHGLHDMGGNVWQWCEDWWDLGQTGRVLRGASLHDSDRFHLRSSFRIRFPATKRDNYFGFRCVLSAASGPGGGARSPGALPPGDDEANAPGGRVPPVSLSSIASATKEAPFVNSLGMKFVPVPGTKVLFGIWHTRVMDYEKYAAAKSGVNGSWKAQATGGVPVGREPDHPVVGVNWDDARAFCQWLTDEETAAGTLPKGAKYRLPTDAEWSTAVGLPPEVGTYPNDKDGKNDVDFPWGKDFPPVRIVGNYADETFHAKFPIERNEKEKRDENLWIKGYTDGFATTSPVGAFPANAFGLYDMGGNVWQWCEDWFDAAQTLRVLRGAPWGTSDRASLRSSYRYRRPAALRHSSYGFRVVLAPVR